MPRLDLCRSATLLTLVVLTVHDRLAIPVRADESAQDSQAHDPRAEDRDAIRIAMNAFALAFNSRDATALASHWTTEGEYRDEHGRQVQGTAELEAAFSEFFDRTPEVSAQTQPDQLRFLSQDLAIEDGMVTIRRGPTEPPTSASYSALFVREQGQWRLASLTESSVGPPTLDDLSWLIGDWRTEVDEQTELQISYSWNPHQTFIHSRFTLKGPEMELSGTQVIGIDPETGMIRTWSFEADGGIGQADWTRDGDHWVLEASGTLADGQTLSETSILRLVNENSFTWQSTDRMLNDESLPDRPPLKISRVTPEP